MTSIKVSPMKALMAQSAESPLVRVMGKRGITQAGIAEHLGVSRQTVSNWIHGRSTPCLSLKDWHKLANLLGTTIDKLPLNFASDAIADE